MQKLTSLIAIPIIIIIAWLISDDRKKPSLKLIFMGLFFQFLIALLIFIVFPAANLINGFNILDVIRDFIIKLMSFSDKGAEFVFGKDFKEHFFALSVLPSIIFFSSIMAILFHIGIMQKIIGFFSRILKTMDISGTEALVTSANMFVGQIEAPLMVRPYIEKMTRSEIMLVMTAGMSTIAMALVPAYSAMGIDSIHLIAATYMSAPASLVIAKIIVPEREISLTKGDVKIEIPKDSNSIFEAACNGAMTGLQIAMSIAAVIIAYMALIHFINWILTPISNLTGIEITLDKIIGLCFSIVAFLIGVEWKDASIVGMLIGKAIILNEFIAYKELSQLKDSISQRSFILATYAICSFANFTSIGIQIAEIGRLSESRKKEIAELGLKALIASVLTSLMTAAVVGIFI